MYLGSTDEDLGQFLEIAWLGRVALINQSKRRFCQERKNAYRIKLGTVLSPRGHLHCSLSVEGNESTNGSITQ